MPIRTSLVALSLLLLGCAPRQDPGIPIPKLQSAAAVLHQTDVVVGRRADVVAAIDQARDVVAENLANADTTGYKALTCVVLDGRPKVALDIDQGSLRNTARDMDVAVGGKGFFRVKVSPSQGDGFAYTRNGNFFRNKDGDLVVGMGDGYRLDPPINVPRNATDFSVSQEGVVIVRLAGQTASQQIGRIQLYNFIEPASLNPLGSSLYQTTDPSGPAVEGRPADAGFGQLQQGFLEGSNVELTREKLRNEYLDRWRQTVLASSDSGS